MTIYGPKNWKLISQDLVTRSPVQCLHRWTKILQPGLKKGPWTIEEDNLLAEWVNNEGPCKWSLCGDFIKGRSGKQCRERWFNTLNPIVKKGSWTPKEDLLIFELFSKYGSRWSKITSHLKSRSENSIKNRFYSTLRRICAINKINTSSIEESNKMNFYLSNLEELLKYVPQAYEEKRKKYLESLEEKTENINNGNDKNFLNKKRFKVEIIKKEITNPEPIKEKNDSLLTESQLNNNLIKFKVNDSDISMIHNSISNSNTNSKVDLKSYSIEKNLEDINRSHNHKKYLINQMQQLENNLTQAHDGIKRFNGISNAYSTITLTDLTRAFNENGTIDYMNNNNNNIYIQKWNNYVNNNQLLSYIKNNNKPQKNNMMSTN